MNERFSERLRGGLVLFAIVFGILVVSGGPGTSTNEIEAASQVTMPDPTRPGWDAY